MKDRWQKSLEAAVEAYDTPMPWKRGEAREEMIARRKRKMEELSKRRRPQERRVQG